MLKIISKCVIKIIINYASSYLPWILIFTTHFLYVFKQSLEGIITINESMKHTISINKLIEKVSKIYECESLKLSKIEPNRYDILSVPINTLFDYFASQGVMAKTVAFTKGLALHSNISPFFENEGFSKNWFPLDFLPPKHCQKCNTQILSKVV